MKIVHYLPVKFPVVAYGGTERVVYWLGKAQAALGHEVIFVCDRTGETEFAEVLDLPQSPQTLDDIIPSDTDIVHFHNVFPNPEIIEQYGGYSIDQIHLPTLTTKYPCLVSNHANGQPYEIFHPNSVFVSAKHAQNHGWTEYVHNGLDPDDYQFSDRKNQHLLFLAAAYWPVKNFAGAMQIAQQSGRVLEVAGGHAPGWARGIHSHGNIGGEKKLQLLQQSYALLFPVLWDEPFGVAMIEALVSGTPVIATPNGAIPEIVTPECGILADSFDMLVEAVEQVQKIDPYACRQRVLDHFTHHHMARSYHCYYERVLQDGQLREGLPIVPPKVKRLLTYEQSFSRHVRDRVTSRYLAHVGSRLRRF